MPYSKIYISYVTETLYTLTKEVKPPSLKTSALGLVADTSSL
jgi:hypothetical protein